MTRGERDYTQRVLATVRPMGILGGRMVTSETFEQLLPHGTYDAGQFSITTTEGEVWEGDAAGKLTLDANEEGAYTLYMPCPTADIFAVEVIAKPTNTNIQKLEIDLVIKDGAIMHLPILHLATHTTHTDVRVANSVGTMEDIYTFPGTTIAATWHLLYIRFNLKTHLYEMVQVDNTRIMIPTMEYYRAANTDPTNGWMQFIAKAATAAAGNVCFDNLILSYEEL